MNKQQEKELLKVNVDRELPKERMIEMFRHDLIVTALKLLKQAERRGYDKGRAEVLEIKLPRTHGFFLKSGEFIKGHKGFFKED